MVAVLPVIASSWDGIVKGRQEVGAWVLDGITELTHKRRCDSVLTGQLVVDVGTFKNFFSLHIQKWLKVCHGVS